MCINGEIQCLHQEQCDSPRGKAIQRAATVREVCVAWEMEDIYDEEMKKLEQMEISINNRTDCKRKMSDETGPAKRGKEEEDIVGDDVVVDNVSFVR